MRVVLIVLLTLAGCGERRSFDERYADTNRNLEERAQQLDAAAAADGSAPAVANEN